MKKESKKLVSKESLKNAVYICPLINETLKKYLSSSVSVHFLKPGIKHKEEKKKES